MFSIDHMATVTPTLDSRAVTFENPTGERGSGGRVAGGRKGAPSRLLEGGETVVLADLEGPATIRHLWLTIPPAPPEVMRAFTIEVFYDGEASPSISVPCLDFFGSPMGRPVPYASALTSVQEGRGFNAYFPMPFRERMRLEVTNGSTRRLPLYFQLDYTLDESWSPDKGYLHATFRRQNPTRVREDFVIEDGLRGPGRFIGCCVGIRVIDRGFWYGEGEVKVYRDGDTTHPTICGTGLEDYVGSAWGMGPHAAMYAGAPLDVREPGARMPRFVGFYRWHVADPIMFSSDLRVTIQQIGYSVFLEGQEDDLAEAEASGMPAGPGLTRPESGPVLAHGILERVDDYCSVAFTMCRDPQPVPRVEVGQAIADLARLPFETPNAMEATFAMLG